MIIIGVTLLIADFALIIFEEVQEAKSRRALSARVWSVTCKN